MRNALFVAQRETNDRVKHYILTSTKQGNDKFLQPLHTKKGETTMVQLLGMIAKLAAENPEAFQALAENAPEIAKIVIDAAWSFGEKALDSNGENKKYRHELEMRILDALVKELENPNLTVEERRELRQELKEFQESIYRMDEKEKEHDLKILEFAAGAILGGPLFLIGYAGVEGYRKSVKKKQDSFELIA